MSAASSLYLLPVTRNCSDAASCPVRVAFSSRAASCHLRYFIPTSTAIAASVSRVPLRACSTVLVFSTTALWRRPQSNGSQAR